MRLAVALLVGAVAWTAATIGGAVVLQRDYYDVLGLRKTADQREVKRAYRKLALELHPDKQEGEEDSSEQFIELVTAYEVLVDPERRKEYDLHGPQLRNQPGGRGDFEVARTYEQAHFDMYVQFASGAFEFHYTSRHTKRMEHTVVPLEPTLEELYAGFNRTVTVSRQRVCSVCGGTGAASQEHVVTCASCAGTGYSLRVMRAGSRYRHGVNTTCSVCDGTGQTHDKPCEHCGGRRVAMESVTKTITIPAGTPAGHQITFPHEGNEALKHGAGDLIFVLQPRPHPRFRLEGMNLVFEAKITLVEALLGFERNVTHLDGHKVLVRHDLVTSFGYRLEIPGEGMRDAANASKSGSLIVTLDVVFPQRLSEDQKRALREIMDEEELALLEDVIRLANAARQRNVYATATPEIELLFSRSSLRDRPDLCVPDDRHYLSRSARQPW